MKPHERVGNDRAHLYNGDEVEEEHCLSKGNNEKINETRTSLMGINYSPAILLTSIGI